METKAEAAVDWSGFDAFSLDTTERSNAGAEFEIKGIDGKPTGLLWTVYGKDGDIFRDNMRDRANSRIEKESMAARTGGDVEEESAEEREANGLDLMVACSGGWRTVKRDRNGKIVAEKPTFTYKGEELPFNIPNARRILTEILTIRRQVDAAIGDLTLFVKP